MNTKGCDPPSKVVVLVVDDDHNDLALFALAVEQTNAPLLVQTALGMSQAVAYLEGQGKCSDRTLHPQPDLVLLDLKMDRGDGFEFLEWRNRSPRFSSLPVIIFSGNEYRTDIERALRLGANAHVAKPMSFLELKDAILQISEWAQRNLQRRGSNP